ncbi:MAG: GNAT family N-acetyltransferase [Pirellulales bacterium]|nr:GNAT family N-acetyltransferase [Pirellulales bacterium]
MRSKVLGFYRHTWRPVAASKSDAWLPWLLDDYPHAAGEEKPLMLAWYGDEIIAHLLLTPTPVWSSEGAKTFVWGRDLYVIPEHRRRKIALAMYDFSLETYPAFLGSGQSEANHALQIKYAWKCISPIRQHEKLFPSLGYLFAGRADGVVTTAKRLSGMVYCTVRGTLAGGTADIEIRHTQAFSQEIDNLWKSNRTSLGLIGCRSLETLRWRFERHPYFRYEIFEAFDREGSCRGYAVVRLEDRLCRIIDMLCAPGDLRATQALLRAAESWAQGIGAWKMICRSVCFPIETALRRCGYLETPSSQEFCVKSNEDIPEDPRIWYVTSFDCDLDR